MHLIFKQYLNKSISHLLNKDLRHIALLMPIHCVLISQISCVNESESIFGGIYQKNQSGKGIILMIIHKDSTYTIQDKNRIFAWGKFIFREDGTYDFSEKKSLINHPNSGGISNFRIKNINEINFFPDEDGDNYHRVGTLCQ